MGRVMQALEVLLGRSGPARLESASLQNETPASAPRTAASPAGSASLALALIECLDVLEPDEEVAVAAYAALHEAGVVAIDPDGDPFDRRLHRVQGRIDTDDPRQDWLVANTVQRGWVRGDTVLRPAQVWVYRHATDDGAPPGTDLP
jgi:hypothetical protein